ncbi:Hydrolase [Orpheovirus IHUMI-LCC2]|uniref:Hydrolase n=1 Tax=Orpheovirus IHUMI-LCC2 TaxID=2023057 RepID=A0A2I2L3U5_9VIRU|nr:Hydrolase [Orpheovirus IHUMI-LCC2]SNW62187.1 Hydrolase [Orpheovirus IHUMI-LCC2]
MSNYFDIYNNNIRDFCKQLKDCYYEVYGSNNNPEYGEIISWAANMTMEIISNTDALYHNVEHTMHVTLVGQEILRGKHIRETVSPYNWLHFIISLLCHDIGYVKGACREDDLNEGLFADGKGGMVKINMDGTDASLTPYHVSRGRWFVVDRFAGHKIINPNIIMENIELTRFPVPDDEDHKDTTNYPGLVRAADLLGQLSDIKYTNKTAALFYEFEETGENKKRGWATPGDVKRSYPTFFWNCVMKYVGPAIEHLKLTQNGKKYINSLYSQVFQAEHNLH